MANNHLSILGSRLKNSLVALLFVATQIAFPLALSTTAYAAPIDPSLCTNDTAGANDEPGQKDLNQLCIDEAGLPTSEHVTWNWDETGTSGANTLDGCALFDTDGDGNINYALCVTTSGDPADIQSTTLYSCGDAKIDRCTSPVTPLTIQNGTACTVDQLNTDPFPTGASSPVDTVADCTININDVGGAGIATLIDVCSYPSQQPNSDPSDCVIIQPKSGKLEVIKELTPANDTGLFNLQIDGVTRATNVGDGGSTGEVVLPLGNHSVGELAGTNTTLSSYNSSIECRGQNGTGSVVASGTGTSLAAVPVADGSDIVCVITNAHQQATLILQKTVVNDNGGTLTQSNFPVFISGNTASWGSNTVSPGNYTVSETTQTGYQPSVWGGDCAADGTVSLTDGQTKTCTITNDDVGPTLTVIKHVINDNGGNATASNFTMNVTGTNVSNSTFAGAENPGTTVTLNAGSYSVDEGSHTGYTKSLSADCTGTLALGEHKTCTITNDDIAPILTLVKNVTNDNGGTAVPTNWTLNAVPTSGSTLSGAGGFSNQNAQANVSYTLGETGGPSGYSASSWSCNGGILLGSTLTLSAGDNVTCNITNNDIAPQLTVTKVVVNNDGGTLTVSSFPLFVSGTSVTSGTTYTTFNAGSYTVSETQQPGYTLTSITGDCLSNGSLTMVVGGVYSCTLTNNDVPATITVTKVVQNNNGGTATVSNFNLFVGNTQVTSGVSNTFAANQQYTVSEQALVNGYTQTSLVCTDTDTQANLGATFTPTLGQHIACVITNTDVAPQLTVIKHVINDNGGTAVASDFTMNVTGTNVSDNSFPGAENPGTTVTLNAGNYSVDETNFPGYGKTLGANCSGTIAVGESKTCVITNNDQAPTLTVVKNVVNNDGGDATADDFTVQVNGSDLTGGVLSNSNQTDTYNYPTPLANVAYNVSEVLPASDGYTQTSLVCTDNDTQAVLTNPVTLNPGQDVTCVITNNDVAPQLTIVKQVVNDSGGDATADDFALRVSGILLTGGTLSNSDQTDTYAFSNAQANTAYTVSEDNFSGYAQTDLTCTDDDTDAIVSNPVSLNEGQSVTCVITNNDVAPTLTIKKVTVLTDGTVVDDPQDFAFTSPDLTNFSLDTDAGDNALSDTQLFSDLRGDTSYTVDESAVDNWTLTDIDCGDESVRADVTATGVTVSPRVGQNVTCTFTNTKQPVVNIAKANDRPNPTVVGDTVTYTLTITVPDADQPGGAPVYDSTVTDLPPKNFNFIPGSWTATSSYAPHNATISDEIIGGSLSDGGNGNPTYGSPGTWHIGNLVPGEIVTLTYKTTIDSIVSPGTYPDLAFVAGFDQPEEGNRILGNLSFADTPFVGTNVSVKAPAVLGATILVNTGADLIWGEFVLPIMLLSGVYITRRVTDQKGGKS